MEEITVSENDYLTQYAEKLIAQYKQYAMAVATVFDVDKEKSKPKKPKAKKTNLKPEGTVLNLGELPKRAVSAYQSNVNVSLCTLYLTSRWNL